MIDETKKVWVYFNLHKKLFSVMQNGIVQDHTHYIILKDVEFVVRPAGHAKVLKEKKKNVHAFVKGYVDHDEDLTKLGTSFYAVKYNPYRCDSFLSVPINRNGEKVLANEACITSAEHVYMEKHDDGSRTFRAWGVS